MNEYRYSASFRITHPTVAADDVCSLLRMEADAKRSVGKERTTNKGKRIPGVWGETYCGFEINSTPEMPLSECLERHLEMLKERKGPLNDLQRSGGIASVYVLATPIESTFGETMSWKIMRDMASLKLDFALEVYEGN